MASRRQQLTSQMRRDPDYTTTDGLRGMRGRLKTLVLKRASPGQDWGLVLRGGGWTSGEWIGRKTKKKQTQSEVLFYSQYARLTLYSWVREADGFFTLIPIIFRLHCKCYVTPSNNDLA